MADRVSAKWIGGAFTAVVLASTAAFGGLAAVPSPPIPELAAGETFTGAGFEMTPKRAVLIDELRDTGVTPQPGERLLVLVMDVTNIDDAARLSTSDGGLGEVRLESSGEAPTVTRIDDGTSDPWLQPGVPAELVLAWAVPADAFRDGDDARVALHTATEQTGRFFIDGQYWDEVAVGAYAAVPVEDLGAGDAESDASDPDAEADAAPDTEEPAG